MAETSYLDAVQVGYDAYQPETAPEDHCPFDDTDLIDAFYQGWSQAEQHSMGRT